MNDEELHKLAHDLRTPLTVIQGFARMLERGGDGLSAQEREEFLGRIREAAGEMAEIVDGIAPRG